MLSNCYSKKTILPINNITTRLTVTSATFSEFPVLLVKEDFKCCCVHYFRQDRHLSRTTDVLFARQIASSHEKIRNPWQDFQPTVVRGKWFKAKNLNDLATDALKSKKFITFLSSFLLM
jgi:hypothetical protein